MELREFVDTLRRRWITITIAVLLGLAAALGLALVATPQYQASSRLFVATQTVGSAVEAFQGSSYTQARMQSYVTVATDPVVLDPVIEQLELDTTAEELAGAISARVLPDTVLIEITAEDASPERAAELANAVADNLRTVVVDELESQVGDEDSLVNLALVKRAVAPESPSAPSIPLYLVVGGVIGLVAGLAVGFARQTLDTRIHSERDVTSHTDVPILAGMTFDTEAAKQPLIVHADAFAPRAEAFRSLRTNLQFASLGADNRVVVVTSALPGEGKTTTAANLAIALAEAGKLTLLVDADLRRPKTADYLGIEGGVGLSDVLVGSAELADVLQPWGESDSLAVLAAGTRPPNPSELLSSKALEDLLTELRGEFDQIVIDAPPLLPVTDAAVLSKVADGALVVCAVGRTRTTQLTHALHNLESIRAHIFGIVVNMLATRGPDAYGSYGYAYEGASSRES
ncbi:tyrosine-protein kinase domain-containing protein [Microbacterium gilvum]|uniref:Polysaccharide biosynthesis tyrosine autokinase n=1 Tax=Microbacterium gilvum TaxID=1336204 RepID=A0ABP9AD52_9MICO